MANICRSPTAEEIFRVKVHQEKLESVICTASAGTIGKFIGKPADKGAAKAAKRGKYTLEHHVARKVSKEDCGRYDYIVAVDMYNLLEVQELCPAEEHRKLHLLLDFAEGFENSDVPDPYKRSPKHYDYALELIERGVQGLLEHIRQAHKI